MDIVFSAVFGIIEDHITARVHEKLFESIFTEYFLSIKDPDIALGYTASKVRSGKKFPSDELKKFYNDSDNFDCLISDIESNVLPVISQKFGLCEQLKALILSSPLHPGDRDSLLRYYPADESCIAGFIARVIVFAMNNKAKLPDRSPMISERIILPAISPCRTFSGRKKELEALYEMLQAHDKIFIYGIGGIGKSEFVKKFMSDHKKDLTNILFLTYGGDLRTMISAINFSDDDPKDTENVCFDNHSRFLKMLKADSLIIVDNFDIRPDEDDYLEEFLQYNCKIVFTTRNHFDDNYNVFELTEPDRNDLMLIAKEMNISDSADMLSRLFSAVHDHTLSCELVLKLLKRSAYNAGELLEHLTNDHVKLNIDDKIRRNNSKSSDTYYGHIRLLFDLMALSDEQKNLLRVISLIPAEGIGDRYFMKLSGIKNMNTVNDLDEMGLIHHTDDMISIHPIIAETVSADLAPDMDNCRIFLYGLISESLHIINDTENRFRRYFIDRITDNVIEYTVKNDVDYYTYFINSMCTYAEVFYDDHRLKKLLDEAVIYIDDVTDDRIRAVYFMSQAALKKMNNNNSGAADLLLKAEKCIPRNKHSIEEYTLAFNIYNNLFMIYMETDDKVGTQKYMNEARKISSHLPYESNDRLIFMINCCNFCLKEKDHSRAKELIREILGIYCEIAPGSTDYLNALLLAFEVYSASGDIDTAAWYMKCADMFKRQIYKYPMIEDTLL